MEIDEALILRCYTGEATDEEEIAFRQWFSNSKINRAKAEEIYKIYFASEMHNVSRGVSVEDALKKVSSKIYADSKPTYRAFFHFIRHFQRVAAVLILPLVILSSYLIISAIQKDKEVPIYTEIKTNPGMIGSVTLPDGTTAMLNSNSSIRYPVKFYGKTREVNIQGEVYFSVAHDAKKRFIVHTPDDNVQIKVYGTEFNVDAYPKANQINTTLVKGSIQLGYKDAQDKEHYMMLTPSQQVSYSKRNSSAHYKPTYVQKDIAWKDGAVVLRNTPLKEALWILSKKYDANFIIQDKSILKNSYTGKFTTERLDRILRYFELSSDIHYRLEQRETKEGTVPRLKVFLYK